MPLPATWRKATAILVLAVMVAGTIYSPPAVSKSSSVCNDVGTSPVIQNSGPVVTTLRSGPSNISILYYTNTYQNPSVMMRGGTYVMWLAEFLNGSNGIYRGTSSDGVHWSISTVPVLTEGPPGSWDHATIFSPDVVWNGTRYFMYYVGDGGNSSSFRQIGAAFSADGIAWSKYPGNPVITHGPNSYDAGYTRGPSVLFDGSGYKMWYTATPPPNTFHETTIAYATSPDGVHWAKYTGNPVFKGFFEQSLNSTVAWWPSVLNVNGTYLMSFSDSWRNRGLATSSDGIKWSFSNNTNLLLGPQSWHNGSLGEASLLLVGQKLQLWFDGSQSLPNHTAPFAQGIGFASCGVLIAPQPATTTTTVTVSTTSQVTTQETSTLISTLIGRTTELVTVNPSAPLAQTLSAAAVGAVAALAIAVAAVALQLRRTRHTKSG